VSDEDRCVRRRAKHCARHEMRGGETQDGDHWARKGWMTQGSREDCGKTKSSGSLEDLGKKVCGCGRDS